MSNVSGNIAFSPDGSMLDNLEVGTRPSACGTWRQVGPRQTLEGHTSNITSVAFSPDGS